MSQGMSVYSDDLYGLSLELISMYLYSLTTNTSLSYFDMKGCIIPPQTVAGRSACMPIVSLGRSPQDVIGRWRDSIANRGQRQNLNARF